MGFRFRKSKKIGPFRVNFSKSGVGYSYGNKYARVTHTADGKKRTTYTMPGTGVSWVETDGRKEKKDCQTEYENPEKQNGGSGCLSWALFIAAALLACWMVFGKNSTTNTLVLAKSSSAKSAIIESTQPVSFRKIDSSDGAIEDRTTEQKQAPTTEATEEQNADQTTKATEESTANYHIANRNTKKYHETWCESAPMEGAKSYWLTDATIENLERMGYTHCKICSLSASAPDNSIAESKEPIETIASAPDKYEETFICFADKTTMIYHNPWCDNAPKIGSSNCYSGPKTASEIESEGYKPCAKCIW